MTREFEEGDIVKVTNSVPSASRSSCGERYNGRVAKIASIPKSRYGSSGHCILDIELKDKVGKIEACGGIWFKELKLAYGLDRQRYNCENREVSNVIS